MTYTTRFKVCGSGEFPWDMLRYDNCFPASEQDSVRLDYDHHSRESLTTPRTVELKSISLSKPCARPTNGRWESFGWEIVQGSVSITKC